MQHAHQKGIIHRDIKPSNVLVARYDGQCVPKVIDFGVSKATSQQLTEKTLFTQFGQVVGTLEYMSPEQAQVNQLDVDTRSDIYSLGVLLYELLTGATPFDKERLRSAAFDEMLRIIREEEPLRPSLRLSTIDTLPSVAENRRIEPRKLRTLVRGELDWMVMKALEKDRVRRYETANGLAMDVQRYLNDEPVVACPPSVSYRFRKFARRNTAVQDALDETDENIIVEIGSVTGAAVSGTQKATITILDDDDPPTVNLGFDIENIPENGGVAIATATLSTPSGQDVSETVIIDIARATGAVEDGTQQQTITIADDDDPEITLTLSAAPAEIAEEAGASTITATLSELTIVPVTVVLAVASSSTAMTPDDFDASGLEIAIAPGETSGSMTVSAVADEIDEPNETVTLEVTNVTGGNELGQQSATVTIVDDDAPPTFQITSLIPTSSGFAAELSAEVDASVLNLYDAESADAGPSDVIVQGDTAGTVLGSLVVDPSLRRVSFVQSGGPLVPDNYTVTLVSGEAAFKDAGGNLLDGDQDSPQADTLTTPRIQSRFGRPRVSHGGNSTS